MSSYNWRWMTAGRMAQVRLENGDDIANLANLDRKHWLAISMPVKGVRFDQRMLQLMDTDGDGRIRTPEVLAAIEFLKSKGVDLNELFAPPAADEAKLADVVSRQSDLAKVKPSKADLAAMEEWEAKGKTAEVAPFGDATPDADAALAAVEGVVDAFFTPPDDMPLVTDTGFRRKVRQADPRRQGVARPPRMEEGQGRSRALPRLARVQAGDERRREGTA